MPLGGQTYLPHVDSPFGDYHTPPGHGEQVFCSSLSSSGRAISAKDWKENLRISALGSPCVFCIWTFSHCKLLPGSPATFSFSPNLLSWGRLQAVTLGLGIIFPDSSKTRFSFLAERNALCTPYPMPCHALCCAKSYQVSPVVVCPQSVVRTPSCQ